MSEKSELDGYFDGWLKLDPDNLPDSKRGPFLATNNTKGRNAHGMPSHVQLVAMFHKTDGPEGPVTAFNDADRKIWGLTHYRPVFSTAPTFEEIPLSNSMKITIEHACDGREVTLWNEAGDALATETSKDPQPCPHPQTQPHRRATSAPGWCGVTCGRWPKWVQDADAICTIPNCGRRAPAHEAFCSKHRSDDR